MGKEISKEKLSNDIICPICKENIFIDVKDYKINLNNCKNNHNIENILLNNFEGTQKIKLNDIICNICEKKCKNKNHNKFLMCFTCNKYICPLCELEHDKEHIIMKNDDKNYKCTKHSELFIKYCKTCKIDIYALNVKMNIKTMIFLI